MASISERTGYIRPSEDLVAQKERVTADLQLELSRLRNNTRLLEEQLDEQEKSREAIEEQAKACLKEKNVRRRRRTSTLARTADETVQLGMSLELSSESDESTKDGEKKCWRWKETKLRCPKNVQRAKELKDEISRIKTLEQLLSQTNLNMRKGREAENTLRTQIHNLTLVREDRVKLFVSMVNRATLGSSNSNRDTLDSLLADLTVDEVKQDIEEIQQKLKSLRGELCTLRMHNECMERNHRSVYEDLEVFDKRLRREATARENLQREKKNETV